MGYGYACHKKSLTVVIDSISSCTKEEVKHVTPWRVRCSIRKEDFSLHPKLQSYIPNTISFTFPCWFLTNSMTITNNSIKNVRWRSIWAQLNLLDGMFRQKRQHFLRSFIVTRLHWLSFLQWHVKKRNLPINL